MPLKVGCPSELTVMVLWVLPMSSLSENGITPDSALFCSAHLRTNCTEVVPYALVGEGMLGQFCHSTFQVCSMAAAKR